MEVIRQEVFRNVPVYPVPGIGLVVDTLIKNQQSHPFEDMEAVITTVFSRLQARRFVGLQAMPGLATQGYAVKLKKRRPNFSPEPMVIPATAVAKTVLVGKPITETGRAGTLKRIDLLLTQLYHRIFNKIMDSASIRSQFSMSSFDDFMLDICRVAYEIHQRTSRGVGNVVVVSPEVAKWLADVSVLRELEFDKTLTPMGHMNSFEFYCYWNLEGKQALVARCGDTEVDHGLLYMPYIVHNQTKHAIEALEAWQVVEGANFAVLECGSINLS